MLVRKAGHRTLENLGSGTHLTNTYVSGTTDADKVEAAYLLLFILSRTGPVLRKTDADDRRQPNRAALALVATGVENLFQL